jgi:hypothetical protein
MYLGENLFHCLFVHDKSHLNRSGIEPWLSSGLTWVSRLLQNVSAYVPEDRTAMQHFIFVG